MPPSPTINAACGLKSLRNLSNPSVRFSALLFTSMALNGDHRTFLAQNEIDFIIPFTPIEHFKTIHKGLAYQISSDTRFKDSSPCLTVEYRLFKGQRAIHHLQSIVIYLQLGDAGTPSCHIHAELLKPTKQSAFVQQIDIACQCHCVPGILKRA